jgi:hypothetical protein
MNDEKNIKYLYTILLAVLLLISVGFNIGSFSEKQIIRMKMAQIETGLKEEVLERGNSQAEHDIKTEKLYEEIPLIRENLRNICRHLKIEYVE